MDGALGRRAGVPDMGVAMTAARDGANAPRAPKGSARSAWSWSELQEVWRHPDMTAAELSEALPGAGIQRETQRDARLRRTLLGVPVSR